MIFLFSRLKECTPWPKRFCQQIDTVLIFTRRMHPLVAANTEMNEALQVIQDFYLSTMGSLKGKKHDEAINSCGAGYNDQCLDLQYSAQYNVC